MPFGLLMSMAFHAALLGWAFLSMRSVKELPSPETPAISAELITPSEFLRLKQGSEDAKSLETKANDKPTEDDSKNDTKKPDSTQAPPAPPPPQEVAKVEEPPPPEPPKVEPPPPEPPKPDPIAKAIEEPPPPEPTPGPTPDEQKALEQKLEEQKKADDAKKKAEDEARKKKLAEDLKKKKLAEAAKRKAEEAKKFDANKLANLIEKAPEDAQQKALLDKDPKKKGQQAAGTSQTATDTGKEAGTATGNDTVLSAREQDLLKGLIKGQLAQCWRLPGGGGGTEIPVVELSWKLRPDGSLDGEPAVKSAPNDTLGAAASEAALRAVRGCQPFHLPAESYEAWRAIDWTFDPRQML